MCSEEFWQGDVSVASVQAELERGADVTAGSSSELTPLHLAARNEVVPEIIKLLLSHGASPSAKDHYGTPVLTHALMNANSPEVVWLLLEHGADPNAEDGFGRPVLISDPLRST